MVVETSGSEQKIWNARDIHYLAAEGILDDLENSNPSLA